MKPETTVRILAMLRRAHAKYGPICEIDGRGRHVTRYPDRSSGRCGVWTAHVVEDARLDDCRRAVEAGWLLEHPPIRGRGKTPRFELIEAGLLMIGRWPDLADNKEATDG
jgi:hypothetical protein